MSLRIRPYQRSEVERWNDFVGRSRNGTFLFHRDYMNYHEDRFVDASLVVETEGGDWLAILPASKHGEELRSHGGLTYGGFVFGDSMSAPRMLETFAALRDHLRGAGIAKLVYKTIPWIYHRHPAEEDRYALFRSDAVRTRTDVLSVAIPGRPLPMQERRKRAVKKAMKDGVEWFSGPIPPEYWEMLTEGLQAKHGVQPVHRYEEMKLLESRFPQNIAFCGARRDGRLLAGVVVYETTRVAHAQYISASDEGREHGALDFLFERLLVDRYRELPFFDFGISNEQLGRVLNTGLVEQKEGFGARTVVHDFYELSIPS